MALTDKLTAIADAIRSKTDRTDSMTLEGMAAAISTIGGGRSAMYSGSFTPTEYILNIDIDVGNSFTKFVCYALTYEGVLGHSVKASHAVYFDISNQVGAFIGTNNGGTTFAAGTMQYDAGKSRFESFTRSYATISENVVTLTGIASGTGFGNFIPGIVYQWYAW